MIPIVLFHFFPLTSEKLSVVQFFTAEFPRFYLAFPPTLPL